MVIIHRQTLTGNLPQAKIRPANILTGISPPGNIRPAKLKLAIAFSPEVVEMIWVVEVFEWLVVAGGSW